MARLSDIIENFIKEMLENEQRNVLEIQRNELANTFNCAPSQINYVLTTRFTVDRGYYIESKRGGGGCIKITRINIDKNELIKNAIWNDIGDDLSQQDGEKYINLFWEQDIITEREAKMMKAVISDKTLAIADKYKDYARSQLLKTMLISIL